MTNLKFTGILCLSLASGFLGCAHESQVSYETQSYLPPQAYKVQRSQTFKVDYDAAWKSAVSVFARHNLQIKTLDKQSGLLASESLYDSASRTHNYVDPGVVVETWFSRTRRTVGGDYVLSTEDEEVSSQKKLARYPMRVLLNIFIESLDVDSTRVTVNLSFSAQEEVGGKRPNPVSTGELEKLIFTQLGERLGPGQE